MAEKEEPKEGGLFAEESDYEDDSDEEEFKPGRGNLTKYDSTVGKDVAAVDLDAVRDNDEKIYKPIIDEHVEEEEPAGTVVEEASIKQESPAPVASSGAGMPASVDTSAAVQVKEPALMAPMPPPPSKNPSRGRAGIPGLTKFIFLREPGGFMTQPSFRLTNEETGEVILSARRKKMRSPNIYVYTVKGEAGTPDKALRATEKLQGVLMASSDLTEYRLVVDDDGLVEIAGAAFDKTSVFTEMVHGFQPRRLSAVIPKLEPATRLPLPHDTTRGGTSLAVHLRANDVDDHPDFTVLRTKEPVFQDGCYRLNFYGRASVPSVKNFQLVSPHNIGDVICQFGKFNDDEFHLDIKEPMTPMQAFSLAICQFNNV